MAINFPDSPLDGDLFYANGVEYVYVAIDNAWTPLSAFGFKGSRGDTGYQGSTGYRGSVGYTGSAGTGFTGSLGSGRPRKSELIISTGQSQYTMSETVDQAESIFVIVNGLVQLPGTDYRVSGTELQFVSNTPISGSDIEIRYFGPAQGSSGFRGSVGYRGSAGIAGANGYASVYISATAPPSVNAGTLWWDTDNGILNIFYDNDANANTWVGIAEGPEGDKGDIGYTGSEGYTGSQGIIGYTGSDGAFAALGYAGSSGFAGSRGSTGFAGSRGDKGDQGEQGADGPKGDPGSTGARGSTGFVGSRGYAGSEGPQGPQGPSGEGAVTLYEPYIVDNDSGGSYTLDCSQYKILVSTTTQSSLVINFNNIDMPPFNAINIIVQMVQSNNPVVPSIRINGTTNYTLFWQGTTAPTPNANKRDFFSYSIFNTGSSYTVFAQLVSFG